MKKMKDIEDLGKIVLLQRVIFFLCVIESHPFCGASLIANLISASV